MNTSIKTLLLLLSIIGLACADYANLYTYTAENCGGDLIGVGSYMTGVCSNYLTYTCDYENEQVTLTMFADDTCSSPVFNQTYGFNSCGDTNQFNCSKDIPTISNTAVVLIYDSCSNDTDITPVFASTIPLEQCITFGGQGIYITCNNTFINETKYGAPSGSASWSQGSEGSWSAGSWSEGSSGSWSEGSGSFSWSSSSFPWGSSSWGSSSENWGSSSENWGSSSENWGSSSENWGSSSENWGSSSENWGSSSENWGSSSENWGSSSENWGSSSENWGSSSENWGSSSENWGSSSDSWGSSSWGSSSSSETCSNGFSTLFPVKSPQCIGTQYQVAYCNAN